MVIYDLKTSLFVTRENENMQVKLCGKNAQKINAIWVKPWFSHIRNIS